MCIADKITHKYTHISAIVEALNRDKAGVTY